MSVNNKNIIQLNNDLFNYAWTGNNAEITKLLTAGADINSRHTDLQATPLYAATKNNQISTVELLVQKGADVEIPNTSGETPFYLTTLNCAPEIAKILIKAQANIEVIVNGHKPIYAAMHSVCFPVIELLINSNAELYSDDTSYEVRTAIFGASFLYEHDKDKYDEITAGSRM